MGDFSSKDPQLFIDPIIGHRKFRVVNSELRPIFFDSIWAPGENVSECLAERIHPKRSRRWFKKHSMSSCECGFYAYHRTDSENMFVIGDVDAAIEGYGEILLGTKGFRSEKARVLALSYPPNRNALALNDWQFRAVSERYGVHIYPSFRKMQEDFPATYAGTTFDTELPHL